MTTTRFLRAGLAIIDALVKLDEVPRHTKLARERV